MAIITFLAPEAQSSWILAALLFTLALIAILLFGFTPRATRVAGNRLIIASPFRTWSIPLESIIRSEPATLSPWTTLRFSALGWPLPPNGRLWSRAYGRFQAHASSRRDLHMLYLRDGSRVLVSLKDPALRTSLAPFPAMH